MEAQWSLGFQLLADASVAAGTPLYADGPSPNADVGFALSSHSFLVASNLAESVDSSQKLSALSSALISQLSALRSQLSSALMVRMPDDQNPHPSASF
jgi:hypothetical protein